MNFAKTKHRIRVNACLFFRQLDRFVMWQSRSHPWNCIPFNRTYSKYLTFLIQDQFLRNIKQCFVFFEVRIHGCTQILLIILTKMY